jgi:LmbE family N-acetylglucosaminyl deacetylase
MKTAAWVAILLCVTLPVSAKRRSASAGADPFAGARSILWIAAHPDDDVVVAPLLFSLCRDRSLRCTFIVATRGEKGPCLLAGGCEPDVGTVRTGEMQRAAAYFGASLIQLAYEDGGGVAPPAWDRDELRSTIASLIDMNPDVVLTFDPRHGTTCHPDHMAVGSLVTDALANRSTGPVLFYLETRVNVITDPLHLEFAPSYPNAAHLYTFRGGWNALIADMQIHRSQFDDSWVAAALQVPDADRDVYVARATDLRDVFIAGCN